MGFDRPTRAPVRLVEPISPAVIAAARCVTAAMCLPPDNPDATPERRIRVIAEQIGAMNAAGELDALPRDTRASLASLPLVLFGIAGELRQAMAPRPTRWAQLRQRLITLRGKERAR